MREGWFICSDLTRNYVPGINIIKKFSPLICGDVRLCQSDGCDFSYFLLLRSSEHTVRLGCFFLRPCHQHNVGIHPSWYGILVGLHMFIVMSLPDF